VAESTIHAMSQEHAQRSLAQNPRCTCGLVLELVRRLVGRDPSTGHDMIDYVGQCPVITANRARGLDTPGSHTLRILGTARD
jgi:hypothetical protein